jgi:hypothetical protein
MPGREDAASHTVRDDGHPHRICRSPSRLLCAVCPYIRAEYQNRPFRLRKRRRDVGEHLGVRGHQSAHRYRR